MKVRPAICEQTGCSRNGGIFRFAFRRHILLPHVGRIADDGVETWHENLLLSTAFLGERQKATSRLHVEKINALDPRVVGILHQIAGGEVDCAQMRGERRHISAKDTTKQIAVLKARREPLLPRIGPHQKRAAAATRIKHDILTVPDREGVDQVHNFGAGIILAVFVTFFGVDQPFKNAPDDIIVKFRKIEAFELKHELAPRIDDGRVIEGKPHSDVSRN